MRLHNRIRKQYLEVLSDPCYVGLVRVVKEPMAYAEPLGFASLKGYRK